MSADIVDLTEHRELRRVNLTAPGGVEWQLLAVWAATSHSLPLAQAVRRLGDLPADTHTSLIIAASYRLADTNAADEVGHALLTVLDRRGGDA